MKTLLLAAFLVIPGLAHASDMNEVACGWQHNDVTDQNGHVVAHGVTPAHIQNGYSLGVSTDKGYLEILNLQNFNQEIVGDPDCDDSAQRPGTTCFINEDTGQGPYIEAHFYVDNSLIQGTGTGKFSIQTMGGVPNEFSNEDFYSCQKE